MDSNMAEKLGLGPEVRELKLGSTLTNENSTAFHTFKYDFKPASVDVSKMATVDAGASNTMTVTVPHSDGAEIPHTVFKGSQKPYDKEYVLVIDRNTGEVTLEKLSSNVQVKKTRSEPKPQPVPSVPRPISPIDEKRRPTDGKTKSKTKVASGEKRKAGHQSRHKNSPTRANSSTSSKSSAIPSTTQSTPASLPMISENDDFTLSLPGPSTASVSASHSRAPPRTISPVIHEKPIIPLSMPDNLLFEDLKLSESDSDY